MVTHTTLPNGLRVITVPNPGTAAVTIMIMVRGGSRYEVPAHAGISHFMEHMFFKGGKKYPTAHDVSHTLDAIGGVFNAYTNYDRVAYYAKVAAEHRGIALDVLADMLLHARVPEEEIDRERDVVFEEMHMREDTPRLKIWEYAQNLQYGDHPLGRDIIGTKEHLLAVKRPELMGFRDAFYFPENLLVIAAGKVDSESFVREVEAAITLPAREGTVPDTPFTAYNPERLKLVTKPTEQAQVVFGTPGFPLAGDAGVVSDLLAAVMGQGMSSRLFSAIRERQGLVYTINTSSDAHEDTGATYTYAGVNLEKIDQALTSIIDEYARMAEEGPTPQELEKSKAFLKGHMALQLEDSEELADYVATYTLHTGVVEDPAERVRKIDAVTLEQMQETAKTMFDPSQMKLSILGPYEDAERFRSFLR